MKIVKLWGLPHSGTNYVRYLIQSNFDALVLSSTLGFKHGKPTDQFSWNQRSWFPARWNRAQSIYMARLHGTIQEHVVPIDPQTRAAVDAAIADKSLQFLLLIRDPYSWAVSMGNEKLPGIERVQNKVLGILMNHYRDQAQAYLDFTAAHSERCVIVRWEDLFTPPGVAELGERLKLKQSAAEITVPTKRVAKTGDRKPRLTDQPMNLEQLQRFMLRLNPEQIGVINDCVGKPMIEKLGYRIRERDCLSVAGKARVANPYGWWDRHIDDDNELTLMKQTGWENDPQRRVFRQFLKSRKIRSMLDCGAGPGVEFLGIRAAGIDLEYIGLEVTQRFVARLASMGITVHHAGIEKIPLERGSVEVVYARHVLEHVASLEQALKQMVRVASRFVYIAANKRWTGKTIRMRSDQSGLWQNRYALKDVVRILNRHPRVEKIVEAMPTRRRVIARIKS